jgi:GDP/UDP-N,N'-diacetylbacillosamine 2-epimerase (hydrolysing)
MKRRILALTGIRSEYDILFSVFKEILNTENLELLLVVTGAHLSENHGYTKKEIVADGFEIHDEIQNLLSGDNASFRVKGLAIQLQGLVQTIERLKPDILLVLGDREEAMTIALAGAYMNIPIAHLCGGDKVIGNVDDQIRHAVTKLAHLHFVTNIESAERVIQLGEEKFRVFNVGNPALDRLRDVAYLKQEDLFKKLNFKISSPYLVVIQHPLSTEIESSYNQMKITLEALVETGYPAIIIYPNSDAGSQQIIRAIEEYENHKNIYIVKNLPRLEFVNLLRNASCLLGNSSAGILEAPFLKLPVINVGNRQKGRLHAENVEFIEHDKEKIKKAINKALFDQEYRKTVANCINPYGEGDSAKKIATILQTIDLDKKLLIKEITY